MYQKSWAHFDPEWTGCIKGYPVMGLLNISFVADEDGWDEQIDVVRFRERLTEKNLSTRIAFLLCLGSLLKCKGEANDD